MTDEQAPEALSISSRSEFADWAIERAQAIVVQQGGHLALAARAMDEFAIAEAAKAS